MFRWPEDVPELSDSSVAAGNAASAHIARRTGFVEVGRERQAELLGDGSYDDLLTLDLLSGDRVSPAPLG